MDSGRPEFDIKARGEIVNRGSGRLVKHHSPRQARQEANGHREAKERGGVSWQTGRDASLGQVLWPLEPRF